MWDIGDVFLCVYHVKPAVHDTAPVPLFVCHHGGARCAAPHPVPSSSHFHILGLSSREAEVRREQFGFNEIKDRSKKWPEILWNQVYGDHWYPNAIPAMMWIAIIVCLGIEDWPDAGVVLFLHMFNSSLGFYETLKASDAVSALKNALAPVWC